MGVGAGMVQASGGSTLIALGLRGDDVKQAEAELAEYQKEHKLDTKF